MSKLQKTCLAISCFLPLYFILAFKNVLKIIKLVNAKGFSYESCDYRFNVVMLSVWAICIFAGIIAIIQFSKSFLSAYKMSKERIILDNAENITSDYYFTYFSLFVLTFFTIDPTLWTDMIILFTLMIFIILVYIKNDMWFINPILNVIGYKSFKLTYSKKDITNKQFEIRVFSKDNLCKLTGEEYCVSYSSHDFSVCYKEKGKCI